MTSSSSSADIFNRLQLFRGAGNEGDHDFDPDRPPRPNPAASRVKRCLFGRGNHEENIKFAKRELEKSRTESKNKWNFDFENERPIDGGRYEWQTSPYPKPISLKNRLSASQENVENLHPASASASSVSGASVSGQSATSGSDSLAGSSIISDQNISSNPSVENSNSSKHTSPTPSDEQQICDQNPENPDLSGNNPDLKSSSSSSSSDSNQGPSSPSNQRKSSRPINQIYRQRKRSKSKVKTQERKSETEDDRHLTASTTSQTASAVLGGASKSSQESD